MSARRTVPPLRLIVDRPAAGDWNMAVDEMLLEAAVERGAATLRLYQWSEPTLSLGYFQAAAERSLHSASSAAPLVRRASGGGAIVHDRELTYSVCLPYDHPSAADPETLYRNLHGSLVRLLAEFGIGAELNERALVTLGGEPFLCFRRRAAGDLLVGTFKVCGSAQRRGKQALLQHGSLLLAQSPAAPELPGLAELTGVRLAADEAARRWCDRFAEIAPLTSPTVLSASETARCEAIRREKFAADSWTNRR